MCSRGRLAAQRLRRFQASGLGIELATGKTLAGRGRDLENGGAPGSGALRWLPWLGAGFRGKARPQEACSAWRRVMSPLSDRDGRSQGCGARGTRCGERSALPSDLAGGGGGAQRAGRLRSPQRQLASAALPRRAR